MPEAIAPAKIPHPIIDQINRAIEVATSTPDEMKRLISQDIKVHAELVKAAGLVPQ